VEVCKEKKSMIKCNVYQSLLKTVFNKFQLSNSISGNIPENKDVQEFSSHISNN
jgi:hypothetical protein